MSEELRSAPAGRGRPLLLAEVANRVEGRRVGPEGLAVHGLAPIEEAGPDDLALLGSRRYVRHVATCAAGAFLVSSELEDALPAEAPRVVVDEPYAALRTLLAHFEPKSEAGPAVHRTAVLGHGVQLGAGVSIEPYAVIGPGVRLGDATRVGAHCVIGRDSVVGVACRLHPHVVLYEGTLIGDDVTIHSGARLGVDGFGYVFTDGEHGKIPHVGRCIVGDGVEIGANSTIDRGSLGDTRIGRGVKMDNLVHIAHNVRVGAHSLLAALVGVAGSTRLGKGVWMGGQSGAVDNVDIGDGARIAVQTGVTRDTAPGETVSGFPGRPHREELRRKAEVGRIAGLRARIAKLEAEMERLKGG